MESCITSLLSYKATSTKRLLALADYTKTLLELHGLPGVRGGSGGELKVPGLARVKDWDVAYELQESPPPCPLKSMLKNIPGSVPNRLDDLQGELANVQQFVPRLLSVT